MPQNPYDALAALKKTSSISGPPPDPSLFDGSTDYVPGTTFATDQLLGISPKSTLGQIERIPNQIVNSIPDLAGAAYGGLKNAYNSLTRDPSTPQVQAPVDTSTPTPPPAPSIFAKTPYQPGSGTGNDFNLPKQAPVNTSYEGPFGPVNDPLKGGHMDFGGPATQPGDVSALQLHQTQQDPNIVLEGLQQARKSEFEDHATQLLKTGNPADLQAASAWKGQAERYEGDLANPNTPLNKMRATDAENAAHVQQGFGVPAGQPLNPTQLAGQYARQIETQKAGSPLAVATAEGTSREKVAEIGANSAGQNLQQLQQFLMLHPEMAGAGLNVGKAGIKPQVISPGAAKGGQQTLEQARKDLVTYGNPLSSTYLYAMAKHKLNPSSPGPEELKATAQATVDEYTRGLGMRAAPTATGAPGGAVSGGVPPELQNLQPGQKATDPTTGETWANRNGQIQRIQ
jgi:hypothetical protein